MQNQKQVWVIGASGYSGVELCRLIIRHPQLNLQAAFANSPAHAVNLQRLYPQYEQLASLELELWDDRWLDHAQSVDIVFLALPHEASLDLAPQFLKQGCVVVDLSAAFRLIDLHNYPEYYGFDHSHPALIASRYYALPHAIEVADAASTTAASSLKNSCIHPLINPTSTLTDSQLLSMPGCYPTAASLALAPLLASNYFDACQMPVVTAVSGVSGAGRKQSLHTSFCEVSLRPYAVLEHRHQCEIAQNLGHDVMFVPQLGNFKRGIVAICAVRVKPGTDKADVQALYEEAYGQDATIRLRANAPQVDDVVMTPFCDLHISLQGTKVVVVAALDNLLKGAASQAIEACNLKFGWARMEALQ